MSIDDFTSMAFLLLLPLIPFVLFLFINGFLSYSFVRYVRNKNLPFLLIVLPLSIIAIISSISSYKSILSFTIALTFSSQVSYLLEASYVVFSFIPNITISVYAYFLATDEIEVELSKIAKRTFLHVASGFAFYISLLLLVYLKRLNSDLFFVAYYSGLVAISLATVPAFWIRKITLEKRWKK